MIQKHWLFNKEVYLGGSKKKKKKNRRGKYQAAKSGKKVYFKIRKA